MTDNIVPIIHPGNTEDATEEEIMDALPPENRLGYAFDFTKRHLDLSSSDWMEVWINTALSKLTEGEQTKIQNERSLLELLRLAAPQLNLLFKTTGFCKNPKGACHNREILHDEVPYPTPVLEIIFGYGCTLSLQYVIDPDYKPLRSGVFQTVAPLRLNSFVIGKSSDPMCNDLIWEAEGVEDLLQMFGKMTKEEGWGDTNKGMENSVIAMIAIQYGGYGFILWDLALKMSIYDVFLDGTELKL